MILITAHLLYKQHRHKTMHIKYLRVPQESKELVVRINNSMRQIRLQSNKQSQTAYLTSSHEVY